ncbi:MAG: hypothetical protein R6V25_00585 [Desulfatiglandales bacterium]
MVLDLDKNPSFLNWKLASAQKAFLDGRELAMSMSESEINRNKVPLEIFSEPMAILNLGEKASGVTSDKETLIAMQKVFDGVSLTW